MRTPQSTVQTGMERETQEQRDAHGCTGCWKKHRPARDSGGSPTEGTPGIPMDRIPTEERGGAGPDPRTRVAIGLEEGVMAALGEQEREARLGARREGGWQRVAEGPPESQGVGAPAQAGSRRPIAPIGGLFRRRILRMGCKNNAYT